MSDAYRSLYEGFAWNLPERFNIAAACADRWAAREPDRLCLIEDRGAQAPATLTYGALSERSRRLAAAFARRGIGRGDRVAIVLPQSFEAAIAHLAVYRLGAIAVPLALRFGPDALGYRMAAAGTKMLVIDASGLPTFAAVTHDLPKLEEIVAVGAEREDLLDFHALIAEPGEPVADADTTPDDPALIIFTSGTTGAPKGALHGHRVLLGHLPGMQFHHEGFPKLRDRLWTPSDWAWAGGLLNALLPSLLFGVPVVFSRERFRAEEAFALMARQAVRNAFLPATALRMMKAAASREAIRALDLRTVGSAGETLPRATYLWARETLGLTVNEFYGQTECNMVLGSSAGAGVSRPGAIGKAVPGHTVAIVDGEGRPVPAGRTGIIAVRAPDPVMFLGYWNDPQATADEIPRRMADDGRRGGDGRGRLRQLRGAGGRHHHLRRLPDRAGRGRGLPPVASGGEAGRRRRQARSLTHRDRQGLCRSGGRCGAGARTRRGDPALRARKAVRPRIPPRDRLRDGNAADHQRQDHPPGFSRDGHARDGRERGGRVGASLPSAPPARTPSRIPELWLSTG